jgi:superfamily II DNA or RNA helicase
MRSSPLRELLAKCRSWEQFRRELANRSDKEKGDLFEYLVRAYLQLDPEYATKLRKVWLLDDVPSALRKKLHLPTSDQGIDLIAETNTGEYWAIQCKFREDTARPLPWREISTFTGLAFGVCKNISFGLVCSTTERITRVLTHQDRIGFCSLDVWQGLNKEFFDRLRKLLGHKPTKLVPLKPRPHQKKAIADARKHFIGKKQKRGKLISPCGSGKSLTAYWIARDLKAKKIVVAVPSLALVRQTLKVWLRESLAQGDTVEWICVCSDESAGRVEQDDVAVLRQDLGVPCLTDPKEIATWLKQKKPGLTVVFTTYQSGEALARAARRAKFAFDLGIMDEAHKTVGDGDKLFSHLLHNKNLLINRRIFMTATERRYRGKGDKILSMDNAAIYGDTFHLLSFKRALETKPAILSDYRVVTILVSREEVADLIRENVFVKPDKGRWNKDIEAEMLASLVALRKAMRKYPIKHAVSFHSSIQRAEIFKEHNEAYNQAFKKHGAIETFHVSGQTPTGTRARIVNEFAGTSRGLITNARCLTEGVDVPGIDCVMFADPRRSAVDIVQAAGRALRPAKGKKMGYVIVPILHDSKAKPEDIFDSEEFQEILATLRALAANDERIIEYFRTISQGKKRSRGGSVIFEIDEKLAQRINLEQFARDVELKCWSRLAKLSWRPFEEARAFVRGLHLKSTEDWRDISTGRFSTGAKLPPDIPAAPWETYKSDGWKNMGDWLGTFAIANYNKVYRPFRGARTFVRSLKLKSVSEWNAFCRGNLALKGARPSDIPRYPRGTYLKKGWKGFGDWLGTGKEADHLRVYRPFRRAKAFARSLKLESRQEWFAFCRGKLSSKGKLPSDVPTHPNQTYRDQGWIHMNDWLGTPTIPKLRNWRSFAEARRFARSLHLDSYSEWTDFCHGKMPSKGKLPSDIPAGPRKVYKDHGWKGVGDWLGTGRVALRQRNYLSFAEARTFARSLALKSVREWNMYCKGKLPRLGKLPAHVPAAPQIVYHGKGWSGVNDWLGTKAAPRLRSFRNYSQARQFARSLGLKGMSEWRKYSRGLLKGKKALPEDIPKTPWQVYLGTGWIGISDWLGLQKHQANHQISFWSYRQARSFVHGLELTDVADWKRYCKGRRPDLPAKPRELPTHPQSQYAKHGCWISWPDWLGTDCKRKAKRRR